MYKLNQKIENLLPYQPLISDFKIRLDANESFIEPDPSILNRIADAVREIKYNRYPDSSAGSACSAFAEFYGVQAKYVTAGNGSDELISIIVSSFLQKGETLLLTAPDFSMYSFYAHLAEVNAAVLNKGETLDITAQEIISAAKGQNARAVIFSTPCNPTSRGFNKSDIIKIVTELSDILVVVDEAYMDFCDTSILEDAHKYDNLIVLKTCSKFGFAAVRLGFAVAGDKITRALRAVKSPYNINTMTNLTGSIIFQNKDFLRAAIKKITAQRIKLSKALKSLSNKDITVFDSCANFVTVKMPGAADIYKGLLSRGIAVRNFGNYLRITAGTDYEHECLLNALKELL